jgi:hypothetical protein
MTRRTRSENEYCLKINLKGAKRIWRLIAMRGDQTLDDLHVVASLVFVGLQIRQSNVQARAAAYQAIGIATSQYHANVDDHTIVYSLRPTIRKPSNAGPWLTGTGTIVPNLLGCEW